jgi:DNA topoisomerase-1
MNKPRNIRYVGDENLAWKRKKHGSGFSYTNRQGHTLSSTDIARVKALVIPPAWTEVHICPDANGHIQATGIDAKGRKQYIYHPDWIAYNQENKFNSMHRFGEVLPMLRTTISGHMRQHTLNRERVLATMVWLLEHTFIRVGNKAYARDNDSYGLTTLRMKHITVDSNTVKFNFKGKSNIYHEMDIRHPRVVSTIKKCIELPGYEIFQYLDEDGNRHTVDSSDVNEYLKSITGEALSAKDFRTWGGTTLAGDTLYQLGQPSEELPVEKALVQTVKEVSSHLGNTVAVCRKYYIHPAVFKSYSKNILVPHFEEVYKHPKKILDGLTTEEYATWSLLGK